MKRALLNILAVSLTVFLLTASGVSGSLGAGESSNEIVMTTEAGGRVGFALLGSGTATVDWGDGSEEVTQTLTFDEKGTIFEHTYPSATIRTIIISGDNISCLDCGDTNPTSLDVSRCTDLTQLYVSGIFTSLDVSKNTTLTYLRVGDKLTADALNALFGTLHNNTIEWTDMYGNLTTVKFIGIGSNPGAADCDLSIAESKGWTFRKYSNSCIPCSA